MTKMAPELVSPCHPTPTGNLPLSCIDKTTAVGFMLDLALVYGHGQEPAKVIRVALSRALVPYYPVAGRIVASKADEGEVEVACTATGVWFMEASADCTLEDVNRLERPLSIPAPELLPQPPTEADMEGSILLMQVTQFKCGGFAVGIRFNHAIFDGLGAGQFFKAVGEMARGLPKPTIKPVWCREAIPSPPKVSLGDLPPPSFAPPRFVEAIYDISLDSINRIKNEYAKETGRKCSTFDAVAAMLWQSRTRAIDDLVDVRIGFVTDIRHLMREVLPPDGGYYGNCVYPTGATASGDVMVNASLVEVVELIKEAKKSVSAKVVEWFEGDPREDPSKPRMDYGALCLTDWSRVGFAEVDYGWGDPIHVVPLIGEGHLMASAIFLKPPVPKQGLRVMASCVNKDHLAAFNHEMMKFV